MSAKSKEGSPDVQSERRETIIHAAWQIVAAGGLSALTIRSIASEIGFTTGIVMHHFATKEEILEEMIARLYDGLREVYLGSRNPKAEPRKQMEQMLLSCLPLTPSTAFGWRLAVVLQGEALRSPAISQLHQKYYKRFDEDLKLGLRMLQSEGLLSMDADLGLTAARLTALIDGIGTNHALRPRSMPAKLQRQLLSSELDQILIASS
ncbi:TetR/AcrR family transcriptional regulator [Pseudomonas sp. BGr12]|uniref:TetR/AcrR family transcriptional regulator n=1 Tax=Pseudomonas sp. BGr12 TaxID=2936269 RepID=UPI0025597F59|nr:TetR family transcriptional regulator C-terminal domain-containing protein [Pseudomonas sp. BJa5]MDL2426327.1 TetR family transcriptional regulator C-terminal domain-containing protein [Pseudomonas sp. BJa5]